MKQICVLENMYKMLHNFSVLFCDTIISDERLNIQFWQGVMINVLF